MWEVQNRVELEARKASCRATRLLLDASEGDAILATYAEPQFPNSSKVARDDLIVHMPHSHAAQVFTAATAALSLEIAGYEEVQSNLPTLRASTDHEPNIAHDNGILNVIHEHGHRISPAASPEEIDELRKRLTILSESYYFGLYHQMSDPQWKNPELGVARILFDAAVAIDDPSSARRITPAVFEQASSFDQQLEIIKTLTKQFPRDEAVHARIVDVIRSDAAPRHLRVGMLEVAMQAATYDPCRSTLADEALSHYEDILDSSYFDEHVVRLLAVVGRDFSKQHMPKVFQLAEQIGISDTVIHSLGSPLVDLPVPSHANMPAVGLVDDVTKVSRLLAQRIRKIQSEVVIDDEFNPPIER